MLHPRPREEALLLRIAAEFPREVFKTSPWQKMIDSGSYKLQTTKQCRKFYYCKRDLLLIHIVYLTRVYNKRRSARDSTKTN
jgi:hypothetical protein